MSSLLGIVGSEVASQLPAIGSNANSPIRKAQEAARQLTEDDFNFVKKMLYYFELRIPTQLGGLSTQFLFPLVLAPTSYTMEEPFTVQKTPTQGGGLYVEENGIVMRTIRLRGNTGFKPRLLTPLSLSGTAFSTTNAGNQVSPDSLSYGRKLPLVTLGAISGQRHFQYLQDTVFRVYADMKRDPATSEGTTLIFHNQKDDEHWIVIPEKFILNRTAEKRVVYEYDIEMTAVAPADSINRAFSEDKSLLDSIKDAPGQVKDFIDEGSGFLQDVTNTTNELGQFVSDVDNIVDSVSDLIGAGEDFINGATNLIERPVALIKSTTEGIENIRDAMRTLVESGQSIPSTYENAWANAERAIERLGQNKGVFETDAQRIVRSIQEREQTTGTTLRAAEGAIAPGTIQEFGQLGTSPLPGTVDRSLAKNSVGRDVSQYSSARSIRLGQNDTLITLAATYLGDARKWKDIATLNGLKPPFLDTMATQTLGGLDSPLPGVLSVGESILLPSFQRGTQNVTLLPVLGVSQEESFEDQLLGTDFEMVQDDDGFFCWAEDLEHGGGDLKTVSGIPNLSQGLTVRINVERGSNPLYKRLGADRVVGLGNIAVDSETARLRLIEAVTADPRVSNVLNVRFEANGDALEVDMDVAVRGFSQGVNTKAIGVV